MTRSERWLMVLLRVVGTAGILAIVAVFMLRAWIDWCHRAAGFGPFPEGPVPEYLARCTSMFYVVAGVVQWWFSLDVRRFGRPIVALGIFMLIGGMVLLWIDIQSGMPPWWTVLEGPFSVALGAVYLVLQFRSRVEIYCRPPEEASAAPSDEPGEDEAQGPSAAEPDAAGSDSEARPFTQPGAPEEGDRR
ncbi:MAG: hypothetical protein ISS74_05800 [Planctomycetes bacterium]|nr:hypothetical protein [Planctomycetota bacterium]